MLSQRQQQALIYQIYSGDTDPIDVPHTRFTGYWRTVYDRLCAVWDEYPDSKDNPDWYGRIANARLAALQPAADGMGIETPVVHDLISRAADHQPEFLSLAQLAEQLPPITWLWENWLPRGMLSLLGAVQGTGKSFLALDLARIIIHGLPWPDGSGPAQQGTVVYIEAEAVLQLTNERAQKLGADRSRIYPMVPDNGQILDFSQQLWRDQLLELVNQVTPELIIVDSISGISSKGENNIEDVRAVLAFFAGIANDHNCSVLLIHHLRKPGNGQAHLPGLSIHDFRGSGHITAMARSVLGLCTIATGPKPKLNGPRKLEIVKTNLGPYADPVGVNIEQIGDDGVRITYGEAPKAFEEPTENDLASRWLLELLEENDEIKPSEVIKLAEADGYTRYQVYKARESLSGQIVNSRGARHPQNTWRLRSDDLTDETD